MCGIVGYVGEENALNICLDCLKNLEYRGYDSAGVALFQKDEILITKTKGVVKNLFEKFLDKNVFTNCCLGHTRWATHGAANATNAHPQRSFLGNVVIVHNGIIENYLEIKEKLSNFQFFSQTDTEIFANLLESNLRDEKDEQKILDIIKNTCKELKGSYAFGIFLKSQKNKIFFAKNNSPLVVGCGKNFNMISSDAGAILKYTKNIKILKDGDVGFIDKNSVYITNNSKVVRRKTVETNLSFSNNNLKSFSTYMEKEISESSAAVFNTIIHLKNFDKNKIIKMIKESDNVHIIGCGTALHAGMILKFLLEKEIRIPVFCHYASEFIYKNPIINEKSLCVFISQSGETADTLKSAERAKKKRAKIIAITNVENSRITQIAKIVLKTYAGPEISVASTKAYVAQISAICFLVDVFSKVFNKRISFNLIDILKLSKKIESYTKMLELKNIAQILSKENSVYFVGRGLDYLLAKEGALKLKEISYIHCEAIAGGELKHGSLALLSEDSFVVCLITQKEMIDKMVNNILEMKTRGAKIILFSQFLELKKYGDYFVELLKAKQSLMPFCAIKPLQELAFLCSREKGLNPDRPRNLAKSVTVE